MLGSWADGPGSDRLTTQSLSCRWGKHKCPQGENVPDCVCSVSRQDWPDGRGLSRKAQLLSPRSPIRWIKPHLREGMSEGWGERPEGSDKEIICHYRYGRKILYIGRGLISWEKLKSPGTCSLLNSVRKFWIPKEYFYFLLNFKDCGQRMTGILTL